eukprot:6967691-Prymnesium_polylepis.1
MAMRDDRLFCLAVPAVDFALAAAWRRGEGRRGVEGHKRVRIDGSPSDTTVWKWSDPTRRTLQQLTTISLVATGARELVANNVCCTGIGTPVVGFKRCESDSHAANALLRPIACAVTSAVRPGSRVNAIASFDGLRTSSANCSGLSSLSA